MMDERKTHPTFFFLLTMKYGQYEKMLRKYGDKRKKPEEYILKCENCKREHKLNTKIKNLAHFKCDCGKILFTKLVGLNGKDKENN